MATSLAPIINAEPPTIEDLMCECGHNHFWHEGLCGGFCMENHCNCGVFVGREDQPNA